MGRHQDLQQHQISQINGNAGPLPDNYVFAIISSEPLEHIATARNFGRLYQTTYGRPFSLYAMQSCDSVNVLIAAIRKADSLASDAILKTLHSQEIPGASGPLSFDAQGRTRNPVYTIYAVRQQQWEAIKTFKRSK